MSAFEQTFVDWLRGRRRAEPSVPLGIGDDMAAVRCAAPVVLVSSDLLLDGVHFDTNRDPFPAIGRKAIACSLSDCAAMAVRPIAVTVSLAWSDRHSIQNAQAMWRGMESIAESFDVSIVGGDTTRWASPLAIDVSILAGPFPGLKPIQRNGARVGDRLYVTGPLGGSMRGKHLNFTPRVAEAQCLSTALGSRLHALMDISDGLSLDLWRMCRDSGVGAELDESMMCAVVSKDACALACMDGRTPLDHALSDGEDFELLLAIEDPVDAGDPILWEIGRITPEGFTMRRPDGTVHALEPKGFLH